MAKKYGKEVPSINLTFYDGTYVQWKKWSERELLEEVTKLLKQKTKSDGRAVGTMKIVYAKDPDGDYKTVFSFYDTIDCLKKLNQCIEPLMLKYFYE